MWVIADIRQSPRRGTQGHGNRRAGRTVKESAAGCSLRESLVCQARKQARLVYWNGGTMKEQSVIDPQHIRHKKNDMWEREWEWYNYGV